MTTRQRHLGHLVTIAGFLFIGALTLLPTPEEAGRAASTPVYCILCGDLGSVDFALNMLLFVPLGIGLVLSGFSVRRAVVLAGLTTFAIELLQMKVIAGRDASLGDLLANTVGAGVGALIASRWRQLAHPDARNSRRLALAAGVILAWIWAGTAWSLGPSYPQGSRWFGAWAPELANFEIFQGRVLSGNVAGELLIPGPALDQQRLEDAIAARPRIAFRARLGPPPPALAPIGLVVDEWHGNVLLIGQDREDLEFGLNMRASILRLRSPLVRLRQGLAGQAGDTADAMGALEDGAFELESRVGNRVSAWRLPLSASWGWSLVLPWDYAYGPEVHLLTAFWIAGLLALLAYWSVLASGGSLVIPPVTILLLLGVIPRAAGFPPAHWSEWAAAVVGVMLGALASRQGVRARDRLALPDYVEEPPMRRAAAV